MQEDRGVVHFRSQPVRGVNKYMDTIWRGREVVLATNMTSADRRMSDKSPTTDSIDL
jgi:hypothetical protein